MEMRWLAKYQIIGGYDGSEGGGVESREFHHWVDIKLTTRREQELRMDGRWKMEDGGAVAVANPPSIYSIEANR